MLAPFVTFVTSFLNDSNQFPSTFSCLTVVSPHSPVATATAMLLDRHHRRSNLRLSRRPRSALQRPRRPSSPLSHPSMF